MVQGSEPRGINRLVGEGVPLGDGPGHHFHGIGGIIREFSQPIEKLIPIDLARIQFLHGLSMGLGVHLSSDVHALEDLI